MPTEVSRRDRNHIHCGPTDGGQIAVPELADDAIAVADNGVGGKHLEFLEQLVRRVARHVATRQTIMQAHFNAGNADVPVRTVCWMTLTFSTESFALRAHCGRGRPRSQVVKQMF